MSDRETQLFHTKPDRYLRLMTQVNGRIYLSLACPFRERIEATVNGPRIHDLFINLSTTLITNPGDNWHLTSAKKASKFIAFDNSEKCFQGLDLQDSARSRAISSPAWPGFGIGITGGEVWFGPVSPTGLFSHVF
jgi:hypothetical protein